MNVQDELYLTHIREAIRRIREYTVGGHDAFIGSHLLQDGVIRNLQTLAESTQRLSAEAKAVRPEIEWARIAGFRNVLVHNYLGIDLNIVWNVIEQDLPQLEEAILHLISLLPPER